VPLYICKAYLPSKESLLQPTIISKGKGKKYSKSLKDVSEFFHSLTSACALSSVMTRYRKQDVINAIPLPNEWDLIKNWHIILI